MSEKLREALERMREAARISVVSRGEARWKALDDLETATREYLFALDRVNGDLAAPREQDAVERDVRRPHPAFLTDDETNEAYRMHRELLRQGDPYALTRVIEHFLRDRLAREQDAGEVVGTLVIETPGKVFVSFAGRIERNPRGTYTIPAAPTVETCEGVGYVATDGIAGVPHTIRCPGCPDCGGDDE